MTAVRLLVDENLDPLMAEVLRQRGYDAVAVGPIGKAGTSDRELIKWASGEDRAIITLNTVDFLELAREYSESGWEHAGIIVSAQAPFRDLLARMTRLLTRKQAEDLFNTVEWLHNYR